MRIISKYQDYYDSALAYGFDENLIYKRLTESFRYGRKDVIPSELEKCHSILSEMPTNIDRGWQSIALTTKIARFLIGFCGKLYPCYKLEYTYKRNMHELENTYHTKFCFSTKDVVDYFDKEPVLLKDDIEFFRKPVDRRKRASWWSTDTSFRFDNVKSMFDLYGANEDHIELFHSRQVPIFVMYFDGRCDAEFIMEHNPCLKDYGFMTNIDAYTAFQELSMFVSGVLGSGQNPMVDISDESMRDKKGFDDKSFKKSPTKKR